MLGAVFPQVLDMTRIGSLVILLVLIVRFFLKKAPKIFSYALWAVVLFRLLCPVSIPSPVSVMPELESIAQSYTLAEADIPPAGGVQPLLPDPFAEAAGGSYTPAG